jgi:Cysteine-rich secretory protein family
MAVGRVLALIGVLAGVSLSVGLGANAAAESAPNTMQDEMALLVGRARVTAGVLPLARDAALDRAAAAHAQDMAALGYMEHEGLDGSTPWSRAREQGYETPANSAWLVVEVISARGDPPQAALDWWLGDGLHRRVVLRSYWREMGIGFARGGPYGRFWVMLFGCRPNMLPPVLLDGVLSIPDETCGTAADAFGHVDSVRAASVPTSIDKAEWEAYSSVRPWPADQPATVQLRDGNGRILQAAASDPTGAPTGPSSESP